jgi:hypothetical protein
MALGVHPVADVSIGGNFESGLEGEYVGSIATAAGSKPADQ